MDDLIVQPEDLELNYKGNLVYDFNKHIPKIAENSTLIFDPIILATVLNDKPISIEGAIPSNVKIESSYRKNNNHTEKPIDFIVGLEKISGNVNIDSKDGMIMYFENDSDEDPKRHVQLSATNVSVYNNENSNNHYLIYSDNVYISHLKSSDHIPSSRSINIGSVGRNVKLQLFSSNKFPAEIKVDSVIDNIPAGVVLDAGENGKVLVKNDSGYDDYGSSLQDGTHRFPVYSQERINGEKPHRRNEPKPPIIILEPEEEVVAGLSSEAKKAARAENLQKGLEACKERGMLIENDPEINVIQHRGLKYTCPSKNNANNTATVQAGYSASR